MNELESWSVSCCFRLSATWATTPAPALWNHSFLTCFQTMKLASPKVNKIRVHRWNRKHFEIEIGDIVHEYCYGQRMARLPSESWHQLFSIPTVASHVSFPLLRKWKPVFQFTTGNRWKLTNFYRICIKQETRDSSTLTKFRLSM